MKNSIDVINSDVEYIHQNLNTEFEILSGKKLLITGGAGFLGYYFVQSIIHWNRHHNSNSIGLTVFDNFIRGVPEWLKLLSIDKEIKIIRHDVIQALPRGIGHFDFIIHAASIASPHYYRLYQILTMDANVQGLRNLLNYSLKQKLKGSPIQGFLFFSTSEIYGDPTPEYIPTPESYRGNVSCTGPRACYDESKRFGETLCVNYARQHGLPIRIARPFNNYGPGLRINDRRVMPHIAKNILNGVDIEVFSDGSPKRTFCYVTDAIIGYFKILISGSNGESYNIGMDKPEITILQLAKRMVRISKELFGYSGRVSHGKNEDIFYLTDNPKRRCPIISKARQELKFDPQISLNEGLTRSMLWYWDHNEGMLDR